MNFLSSFDLSLLLLSICQVIGDLHGQFADLLYILDTTGMPSEKNMYVFNGDFVDRGSCSLQIVLTLFSLMLAEPSYM